VAGRKHTLLAAASLIALQAACHSSSSHSPAVPPLALTSSSFAGNVIPDRFTCHGQDISPELAWKPAPSGTRSFVLIVTDRDSRFGGAAGYLLHLLAGYFLHWLVYDIPGSRGELPEALPTQPRLADGTQQGLNDFDKPGYGGPCPPQGPAHHYLFELFALDSRLNLPAGATEKEVRSAMAGHILARGELTGLYPPH
jgi:Raf kinase inhibitor-like YbhB/YbcL family protein